LGVQRIFARLFPKSFCASFTYRFSPTKITKTFLWCDLQKNGLHVFFCKRWAHFLKTNKVECHFCPDFQGFSQIFRDFARIFDKSIFLGALVPPASYTTDGQSKRYKRHIANVSITPVIIISA